MGKFDGILLVTDLDGTLLRDDKSISEKNLRAIEYFQAEGGAFSFVTGRPPFAMGPVLELISPKIPFGCLNGGGVYDHKVGKYVFKTPISRESFALVDYVKALFPDAGFEFVTFDTCYLYRSNAVIEELRRFERLPDNYVDSYDIPGELCKLMVGIDQSQMPLVMQALDEHPDRQCYEMMRTASEYYEILPKGSHKGRALYALADYLGIPYAKTVAVGDNNNDVDLLRAAGLGVAVANASEITKAAAKVVLDRTNEQDAVAYLIECLDRGSLSVAR